jgi:hypothetical protein
MLRITIVISLMFSILLVFSNHTWQDDFPILRGSYLGQKPPGMTPEIFAPGIVSLAHDLHSTIVFSPDMTEAYWVTMPKFEIMTMKLENGRWTPPEIAPFSSKLYDDVPFFSPDGKKLFFISNRPLSGKGEPTKENIWFMERKDEGWSEPKPIDPIVNALEMHWQFSLDSKGNLYFGSGRADGKGKNDIYYSCYVNERYTTPKNLGDSINTDEWELCPFISPDGNFLIFSRSDKNSNNTDLYVSFLKKDATWTQAKNMGDKINSSKHELYPIVSPDGKFLFFISLRDESKSVYWVNAKVIENLKPNELK